MDLRVAITGDHSIVPCMLDQMSEEAEAAGAAGVPRCPVRSSQRELKPSNQPSPPPLLPSTQQTSCRP
jgi:hypothetical protein